MNTMKTEKEKKKKKKDIDLKFYFHVKQHKLLVTPHLNKFLKHFVLT